MTPVSIYKSLRTNARGVVTHYRSDWRHDRELLRGHYLSAKDNPRFIHVANPSSTHFWFVLEDHLDTPRKYLFGRCTPRETLRQLASLFAEHSFENGVIQYYDGRTVKVITRRDAEQVFHKASLKRPSLMNPEGTVTPSMSFAGR